MNIIFIAPPAAGKGTYCTMLKEKYGFKHISAGDVLREQVSLDTSIGREVKDIMARGEMINDELMSKLIETKLKSLDLSIPFMLDGYPRKMNQVSDYENILKNLNLEVDKVIFINIDKSTGLKRILGRLSCPNCKKIYNLANQELIPKEEGLCDDCNVSLTHREDDTEETYTTRYEVYMNETKAVIEYYRNQGKLIEIDGSLSPKEVFTNIENSLGVKND